MDQQKLMIQSNNLLQMLTLTAKFEKANDNHIVPQIGYCII